MDEFLCKKVLQALKFASSAHEGQRRKDEHQTPYISHPAGVGLVLSKAGYSEDVIVAGVLHDIVEDTKYGHDEIQKMFGTKVATIVAEVTEDKSLPYNEQKDEYINHLETASVEALAVSGADLLANRVDMLINFEQGDDLWLKPPHTTELPRKLERDRKRIEIIKRRANPPFIEELESVTNEVHRYLIRHT